MCLFYYVLLIRFNGFAVICNTNRLPKSIIPPVRLNSFFSKHCFLITYFWFTVSTNAPCIVLVMWDTYLDTWLLSPPDWQPVCLIVSRSLPSCRRLWDPRDNSLGVYSYQYIVHNLQFKKIQCNNYILDFWGIQKNVSSKYPGYTKITNGNQNL